MELSADIVKSLNFCNNSNIVNDNTFKQIVSNSFEELINGTKYNINSLSNSKADIIKEIHAALLSTIIEFARHNVSKDNVINYLQKECNFTKTRALIFSEHYHTNILPLTIKLGQVGTHLPHIVDIQYKIDYNIKSSNLDDSEGPIFQISLVTEQYDDTLKCKRKVFLNFRCNRQEIQDFTSKLKQCLRHCQRIGSGLDQ